MSEYPDTGQSVCSAWSVGCSKMHSLTVHSQAPPTPSTPHPASNLTTLTSLPPTYPDPEDTPTHHSPITHTSYQLTVTQACIVYDSVTPVFGPQALEL